MEVVLDHHVNYDMAPNATASEIARALLAQDRIIQRLGIVLESLFEDISVTNLRTEVRSIERGSVIEWFLIYIAVHHHKKIAKFFQKKGKKHDLNFFKSKANSKLVSAILMAIFIAGAEHAIELVKSKKADLPEKDDLLTVISQEIELPVEEVRAALIKATKDNKQAALDASEFIDFARRDPIATIHSETAGISISSQTLKRIPTSQLIEKFRDVRVEKGKQLRLDIHATDIDSGTTGWAGLAPSISEKRIKFVISPTISLERLAHQRYITALTDLRFERAHNGQEKLKEIHILNLIDE